MNIALPLWLIIAIVVFILMLFGVIFWLLMKILSFLRSDKIIVIDKNGRWTMHHRKLFGQQTIKVGKGTYYLSEKAGMLNPKGKALYIFSENKPEPLMLTYNKASWLDAESLNGVINNKLVQQILKPSDSMVDMLIILGAIGGIIAGLSSIIILLISTGVIKPGG